MQAEDIFKESSCCGLLLQSYSGIVVAVLMLEADGYHVTSVLGNDDAMRLDGALITAADVVVVGFSAPHSVRAAMVHWLKQDYPSNTGRRLAITRLREFP